MKHDAADIANLIGDPEVVIAGLTRNPSLRIDTPTWIAGQARNDKAAWVAGQARDDKAT